MSTTSPRRKNYTGVRLGGPSWMMVASWPLFLVVVDKWARVIEGCQRQGAVTPCGDRFRIRAETRSRELRLVSFYAYQLRNGCVYICV